MAITINQETIQTMKNRFDFLGPFVLLLLIGLSCSTYNLYKECQAYKKKAAQLENTAANIGQSHQTSQVVKTDRGDITVVTTEPLKVTKKVIEERQKEDLMVAQGAGVRPKDVDEISHIGVSTSDSVTVPVKEEPFGGLSTHFEDDYTRIDVLIDTAMMATIDYEMRDSIVVIANRKRHSILFGLIKWKGKAKIEAFSRNPKATVRSVEVLERLE